MSHHQFSRRHCQAGSPFLAYNGQSKRFQTCTKYYHAIINFRLEMEWWSEAIPSKQKKNKTGTRHFISWNNNFHFTETSGVTRGRYEVLGAFFSPVGKGIDVKPVVTPVPCHGNLVCMGPQTDLKAASLWIIFVVCWPYAFLSSSSPCKRRPFLFQSCRMGRFWTLNTNDWGRNQISEEW